MLQLLYLDVSYVSHTYCKRVSQMFHLFQMYVAFECFMLQVQTTGIGVHEGWQGQAAATNAWRRRRPHRQCGEEAQAAQCCCKRGEGESFGWPKRDGRRAGVEETGASHPSSVGTVDLKRVVWMRAWETELARAIRESERTGQSNHWCPNVRTLVLPIKRASFI
jgi:hypothetical protein